MNTNIGTIVLAESDNISRMIIILASSKKLLNITRFVICTKQKRLAFMGSSEYAIIT